MRLMRQKGKMMSKEKIYSTVKLEWDRVAVCLEEMLSMILATNIRCKCRCEDNNYWSVAATNHDFTVPEIRRLLMTVQAPESWYSSNIPTDSETSKSLDMDLCRALLQEILKTKWTEELVSDDALWIIGVDMKHFGLPEKCKEIYYINGCAVSMENLMDKDVFIQKLVDEGGNFLALRDVGNENSQIFRDCLFWQYPLFGNGYHGRYLVLVKEGVLMLPYNTVTDEDREIFEKDAIRLARSQDIRNMLVDLQQFNKNLQETLRCLFSLVSFKEGKYEK